MSDSAPTLTIGSVIDDRYEIIDFLGEGGFATVYRARHVHINRELAIKLLSLGHKVPKTSEFEQRFLREAQTAAQIDHPNVVTIHDFGFAGPDRQPYIVMELLDGHGLDQELEQNGRMDPQRAIDLFLPCLEALGEAHRRGIVHKDLKPENLFLTRAGQDNEVLQILDFGVASVSEDSANRLTTTGQILGTPAYLAPEYITDRTSSPALDVYQMGLILIEALTGDPLLEGDSPFQVLMAHCRADFEVPRKLLEGAFGLVIQHAICVDVAGRYSDADTFREALAEADTSHLERLTDDEVADTISPPIPEGYSLLDLKSSGEMEVVEMARTLDSIETPAVNTAQLQAAESPERTPSRPNPSAAEVAAHVAQKTNEAQKTSEDQESASRTDQGDTQHDDTPASGDVPSPLAFDEDTVDALDLPNTGTNRWAFGIAVMLAVVVGLGTTIWWFTQDPAPADSGAPPEGTTANTASDSGLEDAERGSKEDDDVPPSVEQEPQKEPAIDSPAIALALTGQAEVSGRNGTSGDVTAEKITMMVATEPSGALLLVDGRELGSTPQSVELSQAQKEVTFELSHDGYETANVTRNLVDGETVNVVLKKKRARSGKRKKDRDKEGDQDDETLTAQGDDDPADDQGEDSSGEEGDGKKSINLIAP